MAKKTGKDFIMSLFAVRPVKSKLTYERSLRAVIGVANCLYIAFMNFSYKYIFKLSLKSLQVILPKIGVLLDGNLWLIINKLTLA